MPLRNSKYYGIRVTKIIIGAYFICAAAACQPASGTTTLEVPPSSPVSKQTPPTPDVSSIPPMVSTSTPTVTPLLSMSDISMERLTLESVRDLSWNSDLGQFIYAYYNPAKSTSPTRWEAFDPIGMTTTVYTPTQVLSGNLKQQLGVFRDYVSVSPSGRSFLYLRVTENHIAEVPSSGGKSIEVWQADIDGLHPTKLGELPFLWGKVIWLDNEQTVLLTITYESVDSGIDAYSFDIENQASRKFLTSIADLRGVPSSLSVSPNDRWVALTTYGQDIENGIWIIDRNSDSARRIDSAYSSAQPLWSEDSRYLYYLHSRTTYFPGTVPSEPPYVARYDIMSQSIQPLTSAGDIGIPLISQWAVSGNGAHFLFQADSGLGYLDTGLWLLTLHGR